ncbi:tetratricopeptide repeat protein [uncultured Mucilaginibacter sp.]|uniref:tetratricopeptide repeat protein n=1 Tax=uncultured Mucilaginibacter sp. TaxID=797541 RepID=UPI0025D33843|nr:tetratricopeptide repeat protein [uncultured Mucilaginibacter sp.]
MLKINKNITICGFVLLLVLIAAYGNHFNNGFHFDDSHAVVDNVHIRNIKNIPQFFSDPKMFSADPAHWGLRPVVTTSLAIDYWLGGSLNPFYFQLSTFIWFIVLCVLLFFMYRNLLGQSIKHQWSAYIAMGTVAWYALHTANAETINYVIARSDVQSTFCIVASFLIYVAYPQKQKWYLYIIPAFIGVFAKETVLVLVILLFFYILLYEKGLSVADIFKAKNFKLIVSAVVKLLPLFIIVALTQWYTLSKVTSIPGITNPMSYYILTQSYVWLHYFIAFFLPMNLSADTDWTVILNVFDERIIVGLIFVVLLIIAIFKTSAKAETKPIAFGLIWFAAALLPTSVAPFAEVTNDHRMFFAFVGLALSVVTFIGLWLIKMEEQITANANYRALFATCVFLVLGLNAFGVHQRNKIWHDEESLWYDVTIKSPLNGRGLMNYGLTQMGKGNYAVADTYFERAVPFLPSYSTLFINIGILKGATGKPQEAEQNFLKAKALSPNTYDSYVFYARWLNQVGRVNDAEAMAEVAVQLNPYSIMALDILMHCNNALAQYDKLVKTATQYLALVPNDPTAQKFLEAGKTHATVIETVLAAPQAIQPTTTAAGYLDQSLAYYNQGDYEKCIDACKKAIKLKPDYADAYSNMGAAYNQLKQWQNGIDACEQALKINPNHKLAKGNLDWAKSNINK